MPKSSDTGSIEIVELMSRVAGRDRAAFAALFQLVAPRVKAYLIRLGSSPVAAEELAQEVLLTVWRKADRFDPAKAGVMTWIFVIARNRRIDGLRRETSTITYGTTPPDAPDIETPSALETIDAGQNEQRIRRAIALLPADQQAVITRSYWDEEAHASIAQALNIPLGTVKSRLRLALTRLRAAMEELK
jgi:RNA polymerase sigma-70 factor (ECF subfamily)